MAESVLGSGSPSSGAAPGGGVRPHVAVESSFVSGDHGATAGTVGGRHVMVVSPHYDDVPLSLGQSLLDGALSRAATVQVRVVFGRTNWSVPLHPTRGRAPLVTAWRRAEEMAAALRFGYRVRAVPFEEVILRTGSLDPDSFRNGEGVDSDPLVDRVAALLWGWRTEVDELWLPAGIGRHLDHRIVAHAGASLVHRGVDGIAFYEDRPYTAYLEQSEIEHQLADLGVDLAPTEVSGPITETPHRWVRRIYRSQMDSYFLQAQDRDRADGDSERIWVPVASGD